VNEPVVGTESVKTPGAPVVEANKKLCKFTVADPSVVTNPTIGDASAQIENKPTVSSAAQRATKFLSIADLPPVFP
jgi:hypothetical protein